MKSVQGTRQGHYEAIDRCGCVWEWLVFHYWMYSCVCACVRECVCVLKHIHPCPCAHVSVCMSIVWVVSFTVVNWVHGCKNGCGGDAGVWLGSRITLLSTTIPYNGFGLVDPLGGIWLYLSRITKYRPLPVQLTHNDTNCDLWLSWAHL